MSTVSKFRRFRGTSICLSLVGMYTGLCSIVTSGLGSSTSASLAELVEVGVSATDLCWTGGGRLVGFLYGVSIGGESFPL